MWHGAYVLTSCAYATPTDFMTCHVLGLAVIEFLQSFMFIHTNIWDYILDYFVADLLSLKLPDHFLLFQTTTE